MLTFTLFLSGFILLDLGIPGTESDVNQLSSFYSGSANTGTSRRPIIETRGKIELVDGQDYPIGKLPDKDYAKGSKIILVRAVISNNINEIRIWDKGWKTLKVGVFANTFLFVLVMLSLLLSVVTIFYNPKALQIASIAAMFFMAVISMVYFCYF